MAKRIIPLNDDDMFTQIFNDPKHLPVIEEISNIMNLPKEKLEKLIK